MIYALVIAMYAGGVTQVLMPDKETCEREAQKASYALVHGTRQEGIAFCILRGRVSP